MDETTFIPLARTTFHRSYEFTLRNLVSYSSSSAMIFGGAVPYIPQYFMIKNSGDCEGFSTFVCLTLLVANILRIMFWFGKRFELPLLIQSIVMIYTMFLLIHLCCRVKKRSEIVPGNKARSFSDFNPNHFWKWSDFSSYVECMLLFTLLIGTTTYILLDNYAFIEAVGFLAVFTEACLGTPQLYKNFSHKSTHGMSVYMVGMWTTGDCFKTGYFLVRQAPMQFAICGLLQVAIDLFLLLQVCYYRRNSKPTLKM